MSVIVPSSHPQFEPVKFGVILHLFATVSRVYTLLYNISICDYELECSAYGGAD